MHGIHLGACGSEIKFKHTVIQCQFNTDLFISVLYFRDLSDGLSGDHQEVSGSLRGHVMEGNTLIIHYTHRKRLRERKRESLTMCIIQLCIISKCISSKTAV